MREIQKKKGLEKVVSDVDTKEPKFKLQRHWTSEQNVDAWIAYDLKGRELCTKYFLDRVDYTVIRAEFRKTIRVEKLLK